MSDLAKLYQQQILEHHRAPSNAGRLPEPTHQAEAHNPLCGDRVCVTLRVGPQPGATSISGAGAAPAPPGVNPGRGPTPTPPGAARGAPTPLAAVPESTVLEARCDTVLEARCDAQGCSLCRASGSLLTELVVGHGVAEVSAWLARFLELAAAPEGSEGPADARLLETLAPLLEVRKFPSRRRCVTLSWETLRAALQG